MNMKKNHDLIYGKRIYLRILRKQDASEKYCSWINDNEVNRYLDSKKISIEELREYVRVRRLDPNCLFYGIFLKSNDTHIGNIKLEPIDYIKKKATLGILIGMKEFWSKGYGTEALKTLVNYAFKSLHLKDINLGVIKKNNAAIKAYEKSGFKIYEETDNGYKMRISLDNI